MHNSRCKKLWKFLHAILFMFELRDHSFELFYSLVTNRWLKHNFCRFLQGVDGGKKKPSKYAFFQHFTIKAHFIITVENWKILFYLVINLSHGLLLEFLQKFCKIFCEFFLFWKIEIFFMYCERMVDCRYSQVERVLRKFSPFNKFPFYI